MGKGKENTSYKNSVFVDLFFEDNTAEKNDISLYNALHEITLPPDVKIHKFRVDDILYMNFRNDISFGVQDQIIVFGEHQSTVNYNMPLRSAMYAGRAYEQLVAVKDRYRKHMVQIPAPKFYTFYNGLEPFAKEKILKLSDAFLTQDKEPMMELLVKVININPAQEHVILTRCPVLREYSIFVDTVRKFQQLGESEAIRYAIEECMNKGILEEYLKRKGSQVNSMLVAEYNYELDIEVQREEAMQEGIEKGLAKGLAKGLQKVITLILRKWKLGQDALTISEDLMEDLKFVQGVCKIAQEHPDATAVDIYKEIYKEKHSV